MNIILSTTSAFITFTFIIQSIKNKMLAGVVEFIGHCRHKDANSLARIRLAVEISKSYAR